jgi:hypothetical protein
MLKWETSADPDDVTELLHLVEPYIQERDAILKCLRTFPDLYQVDVVRLEQRVVALVIFTYLPKTNTFHIEDFALHPIIRGQNLSQWLWTKWLKFRSINDSQALTIEVYLQNVKIWSKIMGVKDLGLPNARILLAPNAPMTFMGKNLSTSAAVVHKEWVAIQKRVQSRL